MQEENNFIEEPEEIVSNTVENTQPQIPMDDISSSSKAPKAESHPVEAYGKGIYTSLGTVIKVIAFIVAFAVLAVFLLAAYLLYTKDTLFMAISLGIIIVGVITSVIIMFLIYALGQVLCQNNAILKKLEEMDYYR